MAEKNGASVEPELSECTDDGIRLTPAPSRYLTATASRCHGASSGHTHPDGAGGE